MFDFEKHRRADGTIDLIAAATEANANQTLPEQEVAFIMTVENLRPVESRQIAAVVIALVLEGGTKE